MDDWKDVTITELSHQGSRTVGLKMLSCSDCFRPGQTVRVQIPDDEIQLSVDSVVRQPSGDFLVSLS